MKTASLRTELQYNEDTLPENALGRVTAVVIGPPLIAITFSRPFLKQLIILQEH